MIVEPKVRGFICTTAHPAGCKENVQRQIAYTKSLPAIIGGKKVLVLGASTGYGLASRIASAFGCGAATLGVIFDKPASGNRTASAGWYNTAAFEELAIDHGLYAKTINGDAFSEAVKKETIETIRQDLGKVDLVVYSVAAPRRTDPETGKTYSSVLKTVGAPYTNKTIDLRTNQIGEVTIEPANEEEVQATVKVMGGEDWMLWMKALKEADLLAENAVTLAYSYIGPDLTHAIYRDGSIGMAKKDLYATAKRISNEIGGGVRGYVSINKALVTQSSAAIPVVPLYISILYKVMKEQGCHEGCIEQITRLYREKLFCGQPELDEDGLIRVDDWEMKETVQQAVKQAWERINKDNLNDYADIQGYWEDFYQMFGFSMPGVDYTADVDIDVKIPSLA